MPRSDRAPAFQFYPADFLADPRVAAMPPAAIGAYVLLLCYAWNSAEQGTLPADEAHLSRLCRLHPDDWRELRDLVLSPFELRGELYVQRRMVEEREASRRRHNRAVAGGRATQKLLRDRRLASMAGGRLEQPSRVAPAQTPAEPLLEVAAGSTLNLLPDSMLTSPAGGPSTSSSTPRTNTPRRPRGQSSEWREAFESHFWPAYREHRPEGKAAALAVWERIQPQTQEQFDIVFAALESAAAKWKDEKTEARYIPHCRTWLSQKRWLDHEGDVR